MATVSIAPKPQAPVSPQLQKILQAKFTPKKRGGLNIYFGGVSPIDVALSIRHMSVMLKSGLALESTIKVLSEQSTDERLKKAYFDILGLIQNGNTLSDSMKTHKEIFSAITISMVSVGEQAGTLETNLTFLAVFLKKQYELQRKVKGALIYPFIIMGLTATEMLGVIFFILPKLDALFTSFNNVPPFTRAVLNMSKFLRNNVIFVGVGVFITLVIINIFLRTKPGKIFMNKLVLNFPIIKRLYKNRILTTFSRTLGILLESGIPISRALEISAETINDYTYGKILISVQQDVKSGRTLAESLAKHPKYFPVTFSKIIEVGESTGSLEDSLQHMYEYYEEEVEDMTNNLTTILEPLLLIFIGLMIGILAVIIIAPIYQLSGTLND